ncbi:CRISPR-associated helicase Cas3' [Methanosaeta sp. UBA356]|jgi:CRISPR-associated endonuclease/helicase Cas3|uniref:CRISPR-associated helicase Cas3' n=1 Tax=Methanosaeta sp. UBA356 TaxID=1915559 RepID=UPI00257955DF|nr:CRISPR-associated helicase Cas3' [Methanosaeta sp. UBA356]
MCLSEQIAKRSNDLVFQTFEGHTTDSLVILKDYLLKNKNTLNDFSENYQMDFDTLINVMFMSVFLHDLGKLTKEFQYKIIRGEPGGYFSHAFFGLPIINSDLPENLNDLLRLLVVSHHTQLYNRIYEDANLSPKINYRNDEINSWINMYQNIYSKFFEPLFDNKFKPIYIYEDYSSKIELNEYIRKMIRDLKRKQNTNDKNIQTKAVYSLCLSVLKHCDQKASKYFDELDLRQGVFGPLIEESNSILDTINYRANSIFSSERNSILEFNGTDKKRELYEFQRELAKIEDSTIISAPCGRGKTEGALLGALSIIKAKNKNKIIFALPTQITSNAMYERLKSIFGNENVGLYHGMSRYQHYEADDIKEEDIKSLVFDEKVFDKPVTITTIDHLIYSLVHGYKQADFALGNILNSVIILDEIHYYESHTLRYILDSLKILRDLNIPYIAMSGTLPSFIVEELNKIQPHTLIEDVEGLKLEPFIIEKNSKSVFEAIDDIAKIYYNEQNQIIIVNTVRRAKDLYHLLENKISRDNLFLLHSQFTFNDRSQKEREINNLKGKKPWILVSTQAIEISVDISCDIMHTELAPIDAIGQRGGRLNRGGKNHNNEHFMYIYQPKDHLPYATDKDEIDTVERTNEVIEDSPINYEMIKQWCDRVYSDIKLRPQNLENVFKKCILFGYSPKEIRYSEDEGNLVEVRNIKDISIDVIPERYWSDINDNPKTLDKYKVKIPKWWYAHYGKDYFYLSETIYDRKYIICTLPYSTEIGFDLENPKGERDSCILI